MGVILIEPSVMSLRLIDAGSGANQQPCILYEKNMQWEVLKAFRKQEHISGEELGKRLGISRTAVWKHINRLRNLGYEISSAPGRGYTLIKTPDVLLPQEIALGLHTHALGKKIVFHQELTSTQEVAKRLAEQGESEGTIVIAESQTHGKGRLGRRWSSPPHQGIYVSIILRPKLQPSRAPQIPLIAGVAVAQAIRKTIPLDPKIMWPNDIFVKGKKAGGILTETSAEIDRINYVILGIGLNVNTLGSGFPKEIKGAATSLAEAWGESVSRVKLLQVLLAELELIYRQFTIHGFGSIRERWKELSNTIGAWVELVEMGEKKMEGKAIDIDRDGALIVQEVDGSIQKVISGDVSLKSP
jgi:BirA family biotin operon repressor/biotin-[acetyl-CoA-carboxylase] ligase